MSFRALFEIYSGISFRNIISEYKHENAFARGPPANRVLSVGGMHRSAMNRNAVMCSMPDNLSWIMKTHKGIQTHTASVMESLSGTESFSGGKMHSKTDLTGLTEWLETVENLKKKRDPPNAISLQRAIHQSLQ